MGPVAQTIFKQLGGGRFVVMTGAKDFTYGTNSLNFRIGRNSKNITHVSVILDCNDTYTMHFMQLRGVQIVKAVKVDGIYANQLQEIFTLHTELYTRL